MTARPSGGQRTRIEPTGAELRAMITLAALIASAIGPPT